MEKEIESKINQIEDIRNMNSFEFKSFIKQLRQQYNQKAVEQKSQERAQKNQAREQNNQGVEKARGLKKQTRELRKTILC